MIKFNGKNMMVIESHAHVFKEFAGQRHGDCPVIPTSYGKAKQHEKEYQMFAPEYDKCSVPFGIFDTYMEFIGVDKAVIIQNPCYGDQREYVKDIVNANPGRIVGVGMIDPRKIDNLGKEIDTLCKDYNFVGVKMEIPDVPFFMDAPEYDFMWKKILENDIIAVIDLGWGDGPYDYNIDRLKNVLKKYPKIKMVLPHLGVSRLWDLEQSYPFPTLQQTLSVLDINKDNLYFDTSGIPFFDYSSEYPYYRGQDIMRSIKETVGLDKIMWGSDYPTVVKQCTYKQSLDMLVKHCSFISDREMELVVGVTANKIYFNK
jgi:predicted TIM-barrel fold metal-dependent hydrolase